MPSLDELTTPLTPEQVKATHYDIFEKVGTNATSWKPGNPIRTLIAAISTWQSAFTYWACNAVKSRFLTLSRGDWLHANAKYDYGVDWSPQTFAEGEITLTNSSANVYDFDPEDLTWSYTTLLSDGLTSVTYTYSNTDTISLGDGSGTPTTAQVNIKASVAGSAPSIPSGATLEMQPAYSGLTTTVADPVVGLDDESDQALISRCQDASSAISPNGPADAYRAVATAVRINGAQVCTRVQAVAGLPVTVYLGNASGPVTGANLEAVNLEIQTNVVPLGVTANVVSGNEKTIDFNCTVWCNKGTTFDRDTITAGIITAIGAYTAAFPMGGNPVANVDADHAAGTRWMYYDAAKSVVEQALITPQNSINPIYHVELLLNGTTSDIEFSSGDIASLASTPSVTVYFS